MKSSEPLVFSNRVKTASYCEIDILFSKKKEERGVCFFKNASFIVGINEMSLITK